MFWAGYLNVNTAWAGNPAIEYAGATGAYYGAPCTSLYDTYSRPTPFNARYISYTYPTAWSLSLQRYLPNATNTALALPAASFAASYDGPLPPAAGSLVPAACALAAVQIASPLTACGHGFVMNAPTSYLQIGTPRDWGYMGGLLTTWYASPGQATEGSATNPGFSVNTWVYRTGWAAGAQGATTRIFAVGTDYTINLYEASTSNGALNNAYQAVMLQWPGCSGAYFYPLYGSTLNVRGAHMVTVAYAAASHVAVYVDGVQYAYRGSSGTAPNGGCDLAYSMWPPHLGDSVAMAGSTTATLEAGAFNLVETALYAYALDQPTVAAALAGSAHQGVWPAPPPPPYTAPPNTLNSRIAACSPIHRYGSAIPYPFEGGVLHDFGTNAKTDPWSGNWLYAASPAAALPATIVGPSSVYLWASNQPLISVASRVDFGVRRFTGSGLTVGFLVSSSASACSAAAAMDSYPAAVAAGIPSVISYFDIGGYSLYSAFPAGSNGGCVAVTGTLATNPALSSNMPSVTTQVTTPAGVTSSFTGLGTPYSPLVPQIVDHYTFVSFSATGTSIYVDGRPWAVFPMIRYGQQDHTTSWSTRFFGGNMLASSMTIHDLQIYDVALTGSQISALSRGVETEC